MNDDTMATMEIWLVLWNFMEKGCDLDLVIFTYVPPTTYFYYSYNSGQQWRALVTYGLSVRVQSWAPIEMGRPSTQWRNEYLSYG